MLPQKKANLDFPSWPKLRIFYRLFVSCTDWQARGAVIRQAWKQRKR